MMAPAPPLNACVLVAAALLSTAITFGPVGPPVVSLPPRQCLLSPRSTWHLYSLLLLLVAIWCHRPPHGYLLLFLPLRQSLSVPSFCFSWSGRSVVIYMEGVRIAVRVPWGLPDARYTNHDSQLSHPHLHHSPCSLHGQIRPGSHDPLFLHRSAAVLPPPHAVDGASTTTHPGSSCRRCGRSVSAGRCLTRAVV